MALTTYTTYDEVRAVLGISPEEIPDATLALQIYSTQLDEDLRDVSTDLASTFATINALTSPTADQTRFLHLASSFAAYSVAQSLLGGLQLFAPQQITDGKTHQIRVQDPFKDLRENIAGSYTYIKTRLEAAFAVVSPTHTAPDAVTRVFIGSVGLATDPVTNV